MPNKIDRNASGMNRLRRNMQRIATGAVSSTLTNKIGVIAPITGGGPIKSNPSIGITKASSTTNGYLSSTDWNQFNSGGSTSGNYVLASTQLSTVAPIAGGGYLSTGLTISMPQATSTANGWLSSTDWNKFNSDAVFGPSGSTHTTGDVPDPGSTAGVTRFLREDATWAAPSGGGGSPGGNNTDVQYNASGVFGGNGNFTTDGLGNIAVAKTVQVSGNTALAYDSVGDLFVGTPAANGTFGFNSAFGFNALAVLTSGYFNTAVGWSALKALTSGAENTAVGSDALESITTGSYNTGIGQSAGASDVTGTYNVSVGYGSGPSVDGLTNAIAIGANAAVSASNVFVLGQPGTKVTIGSTTAAYSLDVFGTARISSTFILGSTTIAQASSTANGYLSSTDWTTFNNKGSTNGPAGATTQLQFNSTGAFAGNSTLTTNGTGTLTIQNAGGLLGISPLFLTTNGQTLTLQQTGDAFGTSNLTIENRNGSAGAVFNNLGLDLVDFAFKPSSAAQGNLRFEHRSANILNSANSTGEFQILFPPTASIDAVAFGQSTAVFKTSTTFTGHNVSLNLGGGTGGSTLNMDGGTLAFGANPGGTPASSTTIKGWLKITVTSTGSTAYLPYYQ